MADYLPTASLESLRLRARLLARVREFFSARGFVEVETPILSADVVVDRHLDPMATVLSDDPRRPDVGRRMWLQTSPEFGMKRLLTAGMTSIYQITRAFRNGEFGPLHNPEFTMVEWYRTGDGMAEGMSLLSELCQSLLNTPPAEPLSYAAAFAAHVGVNPHISTAEQLAASARQLGIHAPSGLDDDRDGWLDLLLTEAVQPNLGQYSPTILYDFPASQAALAKLRVGAHAGTNDDGTGPPVKVAERFELYVRGIELANGYHELVDATVLRSRNAAVNRQRAAYGKPTLPEESRLLNAMQAGLPGCTGVALGFDRAAMLAAGKSAIAEVMAFPIDRA